MSESVADIVSVLFKADGVNDVARAFESVEKRMARFEKSGSQSVSRGAKERVQSTDNERKSREAAYAKMFKDIEAKEKQYSKIRESAATAAGKLAAKQAAEEIKAAKKAVDEKLRAEQNFARQRERIIDNSARMAGQVAERQANAEIRAAERATRTRERMAARDTAASRRRNTAFGEHAGGIIGGSAGRTLSAAGGLAGAALAIGGGIGFADSIRGELAAEKAAAILSNSAFQNGAKGASGTRVSPAALLAKAKGIQAATNFDKSEVLAGMQAFVAKTGRAEILGENDTSVLESAQLAKATGTSFADVMNAQGILVAQNKDFQNDPSKAAEMMRNVVAQGKMGAVEMSELAHVAGKITASSAAYEGDQGAAQRKLLGLSQIVYPVAGSAEEAATAVTRLGSDAMKNRDKLAGLDLFDAKTGRIKGGPEDIITKVLGKTGGNQGKIQELGFGIESIKTFQALAPDYQRALAANHGDKNAAMAAIGGQIGQFTNAAYSKQDQKNDLDVVMQQNAEKLDAAMNRLKEILADKGLPVFERFVNKLIDSEPQIERIIGGLTSFADWLVGHPLEGLGALMVANVLKDLAAAGLGSAVKSAITAAIAGGHGIVANPRGLLPSGVGLAGGGGNLSAAAGGGIVAAVALSALDAKMNIDTTLDAKSRGHNAAIGAATDLGNVQRALAAGQISPAQAKAKLAEAQGLVDKGHATTLGDVAQASYTGGQLLDQAGAALGMGKSVTGVSAAQEKVGEAAGIREGEKMIVAAMKELTKRIEESGKVAGGGGGMADPNNPARNQSHGAPRVAR